MKNETTAQPKDFLPVPIHRDIHHLLKVRAAQERKTLRELIEPALRTLVGTGRFDGK
jgi:hypothetical protein